MSISTTRVGAFVLLSILLVFFNIELVDSGLTFPCAPMGEYAVKSADYESWTIMQKLIFGACWDENETIIMELEPRIQQMEHGASCSDLEPTWEKIRPGIGNTDYYDEFHMEVPIPDHLQLILEVPRAEFPRSARLLTSRGFKHVYKLLTSDEPVCDSFLPKHMPLECRQGVCECKIFYPGFGNDYTVHFTEFRDRRVVPISLEYNAETNKCAFPVSGDCKVQPNEDAEEGYQIPCSHEAKEKCLIFGNDFPCNRYNVMKTLELYNIRAHNAKERYVPFRLHYPIPCKCTTIRPKNEGDPWPEGGIQDDFIYVHDYDETEDNAAAKPRSLGWWGESVTISIIFALNYSLI